MTYLQQNFEKTKKMEEFMLEEKIKRVSKKMCLSDREKRLPKKILNEVFEEKNSQGF